MQRRSKALQEIPTNVKDRELVAKRRRQIVDAAVSLFISNGYHRTTTRQIARAAGFSIGNLYEYVSTKEDVLYLVCDAIHAEMEEALISVISRKTPGIAALRDAVSGYFKVCDRMSDPIVLIYQVTQFLSDKWRKRVLANEIRVTGMFRKLLTEVVAGCGMKMDGKQLDLAAHNIAVLGHAWAFRRWFYRSNYSLEEYTRFQTRNILGALALDQVQGKE